MTTTAPEDPGDAIETARKLAFLRRSGAYPGAVGEVEAVETHMSWVFLAGGLAWKLKKPVRFPYLDFSTVEARRRDCEDEVRLNRRLAPEVYLGAVPLTLEANGELALGGSGQAVDWLVNMRRLPRAGMLDNLLEVGSVAESLLRQLVDLLVGFYARAPAVDWAPGEYVRRLTHDVKEDAAELLLPRYGMPARRVREVLSAQLNFLSSAEQRFERRVREGKVVEGHGDLRPEHVCLDPGPVVIDCLEFNREFRLLDALDELAFLALECERLGGADVGERLLEIYAAASGDAPDHRLVGFYKCHRASLRGKIAVWHLRDTGRDGARKWVKRGMAYLQLAEKYAADLC